MRSSTTVRPRRVPLTTSATSVRSSAPASTCGAHVDAGAEERTDVADVVSGTRRGRTVVDERIGAKGDQRGDVVGGREPDRLDPADLAGVPAHLLGVVDAHPDQLEAGMAEDLGDHHLPHEARAPAVSYTH